MADETTIFTLLRAHAGFASLIGGTGAAARIYDQIVPPEVLQPVATPFVIVTTVDDLAQTASEGTQLAGYYRIQFDIYAASKGSALPVLAQLRAALLAGMPQAYEESRRDVAASDPKLKRISTDWRVLIPR